MSIIIETFGIFNEVEATPYQVVLKKGDTQIVLAPGSVIENKCGWGVEIVAVEDDGNFIFQKKGPNISWVFERFGKLRKNGAIGLTNGSIVSSEPIKK